MTATVGISTHSTWTSPPVWPGLNHEITSVRYTHKYGGGGGPATFTCRVVAAPNEKVRGLDVGRILRVWRGAGIVWSGVITQADIGGDGIGVAAEGIGPNLASRWVCTQDNNALFLDDQIDAAISRGLPWQRPSASPTFFGMKNPGITLKEALDEIAAQTGYEWMVSTTGVLTWTQPGTVSATHILWAWGQGGSRTLDTFGTDFYATYMPVEDYQMSTLDNLPITMSGTTWASTTNNPPPHSGEVAIYTVGASTMDYWWRDSQGNATTPLDLRGYSSITFWVCQSGTSGVSRTYTITFYSTSGPQWTLPSAGVTVPANNVWYKVTMPLTNMPTGFRIDAIRGMIFSTSGGTSLDDLWAISPVRPNIFGAFMPQITADQANVDARNKYGRYEVNVDLTGQGQLGSADATSIAAAARDKYGYRVRWTKPFIATRHSLTTVGGVPTDLASVVAGIRLRVFLADLGDPEIAPTGSAVEFVVGETDYDNDTETLTLTPMDTKRKDLLALLGTLPKGRQ